MKDGEVWSSVMNNVKSELINMTPAWDKQKMWVLDRNWVHGFHSCRGLSLLLCPTLVIPVGESAFFFVPRSWFLSETRPSSLSHAGDSCRALSLLLCPTLVLCWSVHFHSSRKKLLRIGHVVRSCCHKVLVTLLNNELRGQYCDTRSF